jgi:hypothetical protein
LGPTDQPTGFVLPDGAAMKDRNATPSSPFRDADKPLLLQQQQKQQPSPGLGRAASPSKPTTLFFFFFRRGLAYAALLSVAGIGMSASTIQSLRWWRLDDDCRPFEGNGKRNPMLVPPPPSTAGWEESRTTGSTKGHGDEGTSVTAAASHTSNGAEEEMMKNEGATPPLPEASTASSNRPDLMIRRSPLEMLYEETARGSALREWALPHAMRTYPALPHDGRAVRVGTPSLAHDPTTNRTVVGFAISVPFGSYALKDARYLMLCEPVVGDVPSSPSSLSSVLWRCQDSGLESSYVPPECDRRSWRDPVVRTGFPFVTTGPEDARLFFDLDGNLGAAVGMRGCHHGTPYGNHTALYSIYIMAWTQKSQSHGMWRVEGYPKLLDLRNTSMEPLGDAYPAVTKSWIPIPPRRHAGQARRPGTT